MARVKISVTADDIARGRPEDCYHCPVARALNRALPRLGLWWVDLDVAGSQDGDYFVLPAAAQHFITVFDSGEQVGPFEFEAEVAL